MIQGAIRALRRLTPPALRPRIRQALFDWLQLEWPLPSGLRVRVGNYGEWVVYNEIFVSGEYDPALIMAFDRAAAAGRRPSVVDLGANTGFFTLRVRHEARMRRMGVAVTAIEALPNMVERFRRRMSEQSPDESDVRLVQGLAGERTGTALFYEDTAHVSASTCTPPAGEGSRRSAPLRLPYLDLSELLKRDDRIDLLKCDIEGSEERVIATYPDVLAKVDVAVFEFHRNLCDVDRCQALLRQYGFTHHATFRYDAVNFTYGVWR